MDIQGQIVVTRARGNYMSECRDKVDSQMHFENADTMEAMLDEIERLGAALEDAYKTGYRDSVTNPVFSLKEMDLGWDKYQNHVLHQKPE